VVGNSGSGKTTIAAGLAAAMAVPHLELDSVFHQPGWRPLPADEFRAAVAAFAVGADWVIDGNYSKVQDIVWRRADTVVWLDPPRRRVMRQLLWRTLSRMARGTSLWNGNREQWANLLRADPEKSIIRWAWTHDRILPGALPAGPVRSGQRAPGVRPATHPRADDGVHWQGARPAAKPAGRLRLGRRGRRSWPLRPG